MKKFFTVFIFCLGLFGVSAFADTVPNKVITDYQSYKNDYKNVLTIRDGSNYLTFCTDGEIRFSNDSISLHGFPGFFIREYNSVGEVIMNYSGYNQYSIKNSSYSLLNSTCDILYLDSDEVFFSKTIQAVVESGEVNQAIIQMVKDFGSQSVTVLKVGLIVLALLLGVSLVPRVIYLFL